MVWGFLVQLALYVGTTLVSALINRNSRPNTPTPGEPQFPQADPQAAIPVVYGTTRVGINVIHKARVTKGENTVRDNALPFGWSSTRLGYFYYLDLRAVVCHGPVGCLHDIIVDGTKKLASLADQPLPVFPDAATGFQFPTQPAVIDIYGSFGTLNALPITLGGGAVDLTITAGEILGGKLSRGGIGAGSFDAASTGLMRFQPGSGFDDTPTELEALAGTTLPHYPNLCTVSFLDNFYFGNSPQLPSIEFVISRAPSWAPGAGTGYIGNNTANAGHGANPGFILWDLLTNTIYGLGLPAADIDAGSFVELAHATDQGLDAGAEFNVPLSFVLNGQSAGKAVLDDLLRTLDGVLYTHPETGLLCVRLLRAPSAPHYGYDNSNHVEIREDVIRSLAWTDSAPDAQVNEVTVEFIDAARNYTKNVVTCRNVAAIQALGRTEARTVSFLGVQDADLAMRLAQRELRSLSTSLGHATIELDRTGYLFTPGQFFTLTWSPRNISGRIMRVVEVRDSANGGVTIEAVEDIYSSPAASFAVETTPEPTPLPNADYIRPHVIPSTASCADGGLLLFCNVYDPQGHVVDILFETTGTNSWHAGSGACPGSGFSASPYMDKTSAYSVLSVTPMWRVTYTGADGTLQTMEGGFPTKGDLIQVSPPAIRYTVSGGVVTLTVDTDPGAVGAGEVALYVFIRSDDFYTPANLDDVVLGISPIVALPVDDYTTTFPFPAAGESVYISARRWPIGAGLGVISHYLASEWAFETIIGDTSGSGSAGGVAVGTSVVFFTAIEDDQWLALSTIPTPETEVGAEYRRQRYLSGAGLVRFNANIKTLTGTPSLRLKSSADHFGSVADVLTWTPGGTGLQSSGFAVVPATAQADVGLTLYVGDGADTAAIDLYALEAEFLPGAASSTRVHTPAFAAAFD